MNKKNIILFIAALIVIFLFSLVASFYIYPMRHPAVIKKYKSQSTRPIQMSDDISEKSDSEVIKELQMKINGLNRVIDSLKTVQKKGQDTIDSLKSKLDNKNKLIASLQKKWSVKKENIKFIAKSLLNLDAEKLSPIVNKLSNKQLLALYNTASNMQRQKLLQSLTPDKAADIVKKVIL